jgi:hypothetical protein
MEKPSSLLSAVKVVSHWNPSSHAPLVGREENIRHCDLTELVCLIHVCLNGCLQHRHLDVTLGVPTALDCEECFLMGIYVMSPDRGLLMYPQNVLPSSSWLKSKPNK